jgi:hypothetical protein
VSEKPESSDAERARLLDHGMHEEGIFYGRLNFFLLFESVLLGTVIQTATASGPAVKRLQVLAFALGLAVLAVWAYAQHRKLRYLKCLEARLAERLPEFKEIKEGKGGFPEARRRSISANKLITYAVPTLIFAAWVGVGLALWN